MEDTLVALPISRLTDRHILGLAELLGGQVDPTIVLHLSDAGAGARDFLAVVVMHRREIFRRLILQLLEPALESLVIHVAEPITLDQFALAGALANQVTVELGRRIAVVRGVFFTPPIGPGRFCLHLFARLDQLEAIERTIFGFREDAPIAPLARRLHIDPIEVLDGVVHAAEIEPHGRIGHIIFDGGEAGTVLTDRQAVDGVGIDADRRLRRGGCADH